MEELMIAEYVNPFEYEAANKFSDNDIINYYIEDYNYSRFIMSKRNIFIIGERGTGKTMTLRYYSTPIKLLESINNGIEYNYKYLSIYVTCRTSLMSRREYELFDDFNATILSEHFLVISIIDSMIYTLMKIDDILTNNEEEMLRKDIVYLLGIELRDDLDVLESIRQSVEKRNNEIQNEVNDKIGFQPNRLFSFNSTLVSLMGILRKIKKIFGCHFAIMIDDAHLMNNWQKLSLNSWIAYRDNNIFSFKVATTKADGYNYNTSTGGNILEGHDFTRIDLEQPYQNRMSEFGKYARLILNRRLESIGIEKKLEEFFPLDKTFEQDLKEAEKIAKEKALEIYNEEQKKKINDYVYKYKRAIYFRNRDPKANLPNYSGLETIIHLSNGVVRNLLDPCYWMYDMVYSEKAQKIELNIEVKIIPPNIQDTVIKKRSREKWDYIRDELANSIEGCKIQDQKRVFRLMDNLAILFRKRLLEEISEPRAVTFTISEEEHISDELARTLLIARKAQMLYTYTSSAKDYGKREIYYIPNRILWPQRGLDPIGQHARVSIKANHLINTIMYNKKITFIKEEEKEETYELFR